MIGPILLLCYFLSWLCPSMWATPSHKANKECKCSDNLESSETQATCLIGCPPVLVLGHFPWLLGAQDSIPKGVFAGVFWILSHTSLGFPFRPRGLTFPWGDGVGGMGDGNVTVYVLNINPPSLPTTFILFFCPFLSLWPVCISFHEFSRQLSTFSLCSTELISAFMILVTTCLFMKVLLSPDIILCGWLGLKRQLTN